LARGRKIRANSANDLVGSCCRSKLDAAAAGLAMDAYLPGPDPKQAIPISVVQSRTPSRAYVFRLRWKGRFQ
jgi:hypothetical protein